MTILTTMVVIAVVFLAFGILLGVAIQRALARKTNIASSSVPPEPGRPEVAAPTIPDKSDEIVTLAGGLPIPGNDLIYLVTPGFNVVQFLRSGADAAHFFCGLLEKRGVRTASLEAVLDFGCGCGRILRHFPRFGSPNLKLYGSDYNPTLIDWCRRDLPIAEFQCNELEPPLKYTDQMFDFVYAMSVFTHLTEPLQFRWLDEMARVLKPGGHLVITVHGSVYLGDLSEEERQRFRSGQLVVRFADHVGENACGAYHPVRFVKERFSYAFDVLEVIEQQHPGWQDIYLLRKRDQVAVASAG